MNPSEKSRLRRRLPGRFPRRLPRRPQAFAVVPTLLTLGNAVCGFGSITFASKVGYDFSEADLHYMFIAGVLIFAAMAFDALDGSVARWTKQTSGFGAQLDSLCDVISFGVAPAFVMLEISWHYHPRLLWVIAVLFTLCAVLRLARFNVETDDDDKHETFSGLPSPAAAGTVASFAIALPGLHTLTDPSMSLVSQETGDWLITATSLCIPVVTLIIACLMVSRIRYPHVFNQWFRGRRNFQHLVQLIFALVAVFAVHELALPLIFLYFVFASPVRAAWTELVGRRLRSPNPSAHS